MQPVSPETSGGVPVVLATHNAGKLAELRRILADAPGTGCIELTSANEVALPDVDETGETFTANALLKARAAAEASGLACVADDSGLVVDALGGRPGVRSARYAGTHGDDAANLRLVLEQAAGEADRAARFVCVAALATADAREWTAEGSLEGELATSPRGQGGFGYDPVLVPTGETRTTAEMDAAEKDAISHRGKAFRALAGALAELCAEPEAG